MTPGTALILLVVILFPSGLVVTYTMAVVSDHLRPTWCFISYTGNYPVESCVFSLLLNLSSVLYVGIVLLRYMQISQVISASGPSFSKMRYCNAVSLMSGAAGALGLSMAGSFQQKNFRVLHIMGVFLLTYGSLVYWVFQTYFSFFLGPLRTLRSVKILRLIVTVASFVNIAVGSALAVFFSVQRISECDFISTSPIDSNDPVFVSGVILEWTLFAFHLIITCSLYPDFKNIEIEKDKIVFLQ